MKWIPKNRYRASAKLASARPVTSAEPQNINGMHEASMPIGE